MAGRRATGVYVDDEGNTSWVVANADGSSIGGGSGGTVAQGAAGSAAWPVAPQQIISTTATLSNVAASTSSVQLLAANTSAVARKIVNDADRICYIKYGATASATSYTDVLAPAVSSVGGVHVVDGNYTGRIDAIWASGVAGTARITELT